MSKITLTALTAFACAAPALADEATAPTKDIHAAVAKALPLLQKGAVGHMANRNCFACHNQGIPILAMTTARSRGFAINDEEIQKHLKYIADFLDRNRDNYLQGKGQGGNADTAGYALWTLEMGGWKADATTAAVTEFLLLYNKDLDHWRANSQRPPSEASPFTTTYVALRGLQTFGTKEQKERIEKRAKVVRGWLLKTKAKDTEDRVFRLWVMKRAGVEAKEVQVAADELIKTQSSAGGWAQLATTKPDAYATGSALVALHEAAGLATTDAVYQRGLKFLLTTQLPDGSWYVHSRSKPFQLYFESGFPHGKDQFISISASSWATTALALSLPTTPRSSKSEARNPKQIPNPKSE